MKRPVAINMLIKNQQPANVLELTEMCMKHNILDLYIWLSLRFPDWFVEQKQCLERKEFCIEMIEAALENEDLNHVFCHANEYLTIRQKQAGERSDNNDIQTRHLLPPPNFGEVRQIAEKLMAEKHPNSLFVFPHRAAKPQRGAFSDRFNKGPREGDGFKKHGHPHKHHDRHKSTRHHGANNVKPSGEPSPTDVAREEARLRSAAREASSTENTGNAKDQRSDDKRGKSNAHGRHSGGNTSKKENDKYDKKLKSGNNAKNDLSRTSKKKSDFSDNDSTSLKTKVVVVTA